LEKQQYMEKYKIWQGNIMNPVEMLMNLYANHTCQQYKNVNQNRLS